jgi:hypothetical protein
MVGLVNISQKIAITAKRLESRNKPDAIEPIEAGRQGCRLGGCVPCHVAQADQFLQREAFIPAESNIAIRVARCPEWPR